MLPTASNDQAAVVTGASSGIGEEIAREFARRGYQLVLVARRADRLHGLAESLGSGAHVLPADLSRSQDRAALLDRVTALGLQPDILVNNAGLTTVGPVAESSPEAELNLVEVDVAAVVDLCSRFVPGMVFRPRGGGGHLQAGCRGRAAESSVDHRRRGGQGCGGRPGIG
jgi:short-subunit dehydrogenase